MAALSSATFVLVPYADRAEAMPGVPRLPVAAGVEFALWAEAMDAWTTAMDVWIDKQPDHRALRSILALIRETSGSAREKMVAFIGAVARGSAHLVLDEATREWRFDG